MKYVISVIIVTGGHPNDYSAEAINSDGTRLCKLPDLPTPRAYHTMSGGMICGGHDNFDIRESCIKFENGEWVEYPWKLQEERVNHVSWTRPNGKTRLLGGFYEPKKSEIVSETGSEAGFPLKHRT